MARAAKISLLGVICILLGWWLSTAFIKKPESNNSYQPMFIYNKNGLQQSRPLKIWSDTVQMTSNTSSVNISSAGFQTVCGVQVQGMKSSSTNVTFPLINVESYTATSVSLKMYQSNGTLVSVLGFNVLSGAAVGNYSSPTDVWAIVTVCGF